ncbi:MAG: ATP synthase subunit I [Neisseria animaloris]|uniref:ATP synthase subunit I n=1 Tax=Neisseria animaloris TaxID=326522 RepID=UPI000A18C2D6|nr:ATP synthase subunit I [Neisseria animaloris]MDO5073998.1 ATP synthase subunit I [Neisseria animaloris]OSI07261.1 F0F1 ATP synthase subunit I [Neisseria animaloris]
MNKILYIQLSALSVTSVICTLVSGIKGFLSSWAGGLCYLLPSAVAVLLLSFLKRYPQVAAKAFLFVESLKVVLSLVLMLIVFYFWHASLTFIPFLAGLFAVSHLVFLALLRVRNYGR